MTTQARGSAIRRGILAIAGAAALITAVPLAAHADWYGWYGPGWYDPGWYDGRRADEWRRERWHEHELRMAERRHEAWERDRRLREGWENPGYYRYPEPREGGR